MLIYIDDLIVLSDDEDCGLRNLKIVLDVTSRVGLVINWGKCRFLQRKVEFLCHVVEDGTICLSEQKTKVVMRFLEPRSVRQVHSSD